MTAKLWNSFHRFIQRVDTVRDTGPISLWLRLHHISYRVDIWNWPVSQNVTVYDVKLVDSVILFIVLQKYQDHWGQSYTPLTPPLVQPRLPSMRSHIPHQRCPGALWELWRALVGCYIRLFRRVRSRLVRQTHRRGVSLMGKMAAGVHCLILNPSTRQKRLVRGTFLLHPAKAAARV